MHPDVRWRSVAESLPPADEMGACRRRSAPLVFLTVTGDLPVAGRYYPEHVRHIPEANGSIVRERAYWIGGCRTYGPDEVTHWMILPTLPAEVVDAH